MTADATFETTMPSPLGELTLAASPAGLVRLRFASERPDQGRSPHGPRRDVAGADARSRSHLDAAARQLAEYFAGRRRGFDLTLDLRGTDFDRLVWHELTRIPHGTTISYGTLARRLGRPGASRAVGHANGRNPIPIVVPCHRVVASGGGLGGYGGGLAIKRALLDLEVGARPLLPATVADGAGGAVLVLPPERRGPA